jgi:hypothetical protein
MSMDASRIITLVVFSAVALVAVTAIALTLFTLLRGLLSREQKPPAVARRVHFKAPRTRPLVQGGWERQIKIKDDDGAP